MIPAPSNAGIPESVVLRANAGLIRDAYTEFKDDDNWLVIRQITFDSQGASPAIKSIRLTTVEVEAVFRLWKMVSPLPDNSTMSLLQESTQPKGKTK